MIRAWPGLVLMISAIGIAAFGAQPSGAAETPADEAAAPKVKYRQSKDVDFEALLIQGQLQRPEVSVVTGESDQGMEGLLRLRQDFVDKIARDFGEDIQGEGTR